MEKIAFFANPTGENEALERFFGCFKNSKTEVACLAEHVRSLASLLNDERAKRYQDTFRNNAKEVVSDFCERLSKHKINCSGQTVLEGFYPDAVLEWAEGLKAEIIVKQSLPCDGDFGQVSKGDISLARHSKVPVLLAHPNPETNNKVLAGIAPFHDNKALDSLWVRVINNAAKWCELLNSRLVVVNAFQVWGEYLMRSKVPDAEVEEVIEAHEKSAEEGVKRIIEQSEIGKLKVETVIAKGDPTRVLNASIDLHKPSLIVLGSSAKENVKEMLLGNTAETVLRQKSYSTLILKG